MANSVSVMEVYQLVDKKVGEVQTSVDKVNDKIDNIVLTEISTLRAKIANMEGRLMMVPFLISIALNAFFLIINYVLGRLK